MPGSLSHSLDPTSSTPPLEELTLMFTLICGLFVMFMQCGFALLESGAVRKKNVRNILLKNAVDACISTICWWALGDAFAYGECGQNGFIGHANFFTSSGSTTSASFSGAWLFSWAFSATAATVVSGAVAERAQFKAYVIYTFLISAWVYPVVVHWVWSDSGWLAARRKGCDEDYYTPLFSKTNGLMDFAGSGVVHMVGGGAALMGAIALGPRLGRFGDNGTVNHFDQASPTNMALGVFILWLGWYAFNAGSTGCFQGCMKIANQVAVNTTLSVGASGLSCLALAVLLGEAGDIGPLLNGILAGAVSITGSCALVEDYAAVVIGVVGALVYTGSSKLLLRLQIDDPLDAAPVHFFCGMWGLLAAGFFATESATTAAYTYANDWGVFYGGQGYQLGMQVLGIVVITAWTCLQAGAMFWLLNKVDWLRVPKEVEVQGLDFAQSLKGTYLSRYKSAVYWAHAGARATKLPASRQDVEAGVRPVTQVRLGGSGTAAAAAASFNSAQL